MSYEGERDGWVKRALLNSVVVVDNMEDRR